MGQQGAALVTVQRLLQTPNIMSRIEQVLGERAPQFASSVVSLTNASRQLKECDPNTIVASAMIAATLDLPVNKELGFAHIIPYKKKAQFQMGYKGFIQLAMRSGQYARMNAEAITEGAFGGWDDIGEPIIKWGDIDPEKQVIGFAFAFRLVNGFGKTAYWTMAKVEKHAKDYSQAVRGNKTDSPWFTNFNRMALKTVIKNTLSQWGILSVQMQKAMAADQAVHTDVDAAPEYPDNPDDDSPKDVTSEAKQADAAHAEALKAAKAAGVYTPDMADMTAEQVADATRKALEAQQQAGDGDGAGAPPPQRTDTERAADASNRHRAVLAELGTAMSVVGEEISGQARADVGIGPDDELSQIGIRKLNKLLAQIQVLGKDALEAAENEEPPFEDEPPEGEQQAEPPEQATFA